MTHEHPNCRLSMNSKGHAISCTHVVDEGKPILFVTHDGDGDWQFLCGGEHEDSESGRVVCIGCMTERHPELQELAALGCGEYAERSGPDAEWSIVDPFWEELEHNIAEHGWQVTHVGADEDGPCFSYSIGIWQTLQKPEIIVFGLHPEVAQFLINELGDRMRAGTPISLGERIGGLLEGADCVLRPMHESWFPEYLGAAIGHYEGARFEAWHCVWPGPECGLFPWEDGVEDIVRAYQPDLSLPAAKST